MGHSKFTAAVCQLRTETDLSLTLEKAEAMVREAAANGADVVCLPEMFTCPYASAYFHKFADAGHTQALEEMSAWAKDNHILLIGGSVPELSEGKLYNTCFVFNQDGRQIARHRKVHLFDVDLPGMRFFESHTFSPGNEITVFDTDFGRMGVGICFDVRFPELFRAMAKRGAEVIFLPAQFNMTTGPAHWQPTLRMRALDNEVFFIAASAARYEGFAYECWGHSTVVDPYGAVIASCDEKEQILYASIDTTRVDEVRAQLPTFTKLREDIYPVAR